jgi:hypothetical protein
MPTIPKEISTAAIISAWVAWIGPRSNTGFMAPPTSLSAFLTVLIEALGLHLAAVLVHRDGFNFP